MLTIFSGVVFASAMAKKEGILQYPMLASLVYIIFVIPQIIGIRSSLIGINDPDLFILELFCIICLGALVLGWRAGISYGSRSILSNAPTRKVVQLTIFLTVFSFAMTLMITMRVVDTSDGSSDVNWSGPITIIYFFSNLRVVSLFLSVYLFLSGERRKLFIILIAVHIMMYLPLLVVYFRRREALEVFTAVSMAYWYTKGLVLSRTLFLISTPFAMLFVFGVGVLRGLGWDSLTDVSLAQLTQIDFWSYTPFQNNMQFPEMKNAHYIVQHLNDGVSFTLGADTWNRFIFQWVPGQLVGRDLKAALMFDINIFSQALQNAGAVHRIGSTNTAFGDAYMEGGFLGCVFFFATAFVVGIWWEKARRGDVRARIYYAVGIAPATLMLTAYPAYFFNYVLLFILFILLLLRMPVIVLQARTRPY